ncbi:peroxidase 12-like [Diospyros lotus]|uniref:peroxidase 12-like n=1 Tax=Diospyros lotus TaxID=55363 RepID=UPI0022579FFF|nr:peroxidase 12-like [Diospyros lotus]
MYSLPGCGKAAMAVEVAVLAALLFSSLNCFVCFQQQQAEALQLQTLPPLLEGLEWGFYESSCPDLESIIRTELAQVFAQDIGQAAGLLRLHFHDCFVQGCDGSVLIDGSFRGPNEKSATPNQSLRNESFRIINDLHQLIQQQCGTCVVSCTDIVTIAARDSVYLSGGPDYPIPLGRRDSLSYATRDETLASIPAPSDNTTVLLSTFASNNLSATDLVALSGGHTIGQGHCSAFDDRLYPTQDPTMNSTYADTLKAVCPVLNSTNATVLDIRTPNVFDNQYFVDLVNREGLFTSDQDLYTDNRTRDIVESFAADQDLFIQKFVEGMIKMGQMQVLTGTEGEIRVNCSAINAASPPANPPLASVVEVEEEAAAAEF